MAYVNPFLRLVLIGRLYDVEDFSFSLNFINGPALTPPAAVFPAVIAECQRYIGNSEAGISLHAELTQVKLNLIGEDGRYVGDETVFADIDPPTPGGSSSNPYPQLSLAVTTLTAASRGRASKGRWYLPIPGASADGDGRISPAYQSAAVGQARTFLTNLNAALDPWVAGVVSNVGSGTERVITGVKVGRVMDTMRSRRDKFEEEYVQLDLL